MTYEVFISYAYEDKKAADAVCHALEQQRLRCWIAPRDILPGAEWGAAIVDAIDTVKVMVLVFSSHSNRSPQVKREIERAVSKSVVLLPFRIEEVFPCKTLEYFLGTQHWLDAFRQPLAPHLETLTRTVKAILAAEEEQRPLFAVARSSTPPPPDPVEAARDCADQTPGAFAAEDLAAVQARLAYYIGPLAKVLVCRAAQTAGSMEELIGMLGREIEDADERAAFVSAFGLIST